MFWYTDDYTNVRSLGTTVSSLISLFVIVIVKKTYDQI